MTARNPQTLTLGFSTCPNDTFIFDAMVNGKIDTEGLIFQPVLADVEELNRKAFNGDIDITKLSYHAYGYLSENYILLNSGSALGNNCGPLLISKRKVEQPEQEVPSMAIAIPGKYTTAHFLFSIAYPKADNKREMLFSDIEKAVLSGEVDAGVIIHENRFTYQQKGLKKVVDLGEYWEQTTGLPIPLGGIAIRRNLPEYLQQKVDRVLQRSVEYALNNPDSAKEYVRRYAQEMDEEVMYSHIDLYVNDYTVALGEKGKEAVSYLYNTAVEKGIIKPVHPKIFVS